MLCAGARPTQAKALIQAQVQAQVQVQIQIQALVQILVRAWVQDLIQAQRRAFQYLWSAEIESADLQRQSERAAQETVIVLPDAAVH